MFRLALAPKTTTYDLDHYVYAVLTAGASGFLLKDVTPERLVAALHLVQSDDALLVPTITRRLIERFARREEPQTIAPHRDLSGLTPRELEVLRLLATGLSNAELASLLFLSPTTVKSHIGRILSKLDLRDRVQAVVFAYETGPIAPGGGAQNMSGRSCAEPDGQRCCRGCAEEERIRARRITWSWSGTA